jgi:heme o synthase
VNSAALAIDARAARAPTRARDYLALTKPRVVTMVLATTLAGFYLGSGASFDFVLALKLILGTALAAGGTLALNQYIERDLDALMHRTRTRPLPGGRLDPREALAFGVAATASGLAVLSAGVNLLSATIVLAIAVIYLFFYTPLKRMSWICNMVGAVPGALPPVAGWAAARGTIGAEAIVLFAVMWLWQMPHSMAIASLYHSDYARAGIHLLPPDGRRSNPAGSLIVANCAALLLAGALPTLMGFAGLAYLVVALALGLGFLFFAIRLKAAPMTAAAARNVVLASIVYLPVVLLALALDRI